MAHNVKCCYCNEIFDTEKEGYVKPRVNRYAHLLCDQKHKEDILKQEEEIRILKEAVVIKENAKKNNLVKCLICGDYVDKDSEECVKVSSMRYAHKHCVGDEDEMIEKIEFFDYTSQLFGKSYDHLRTVRLAEKYKNENKEWTWSGMKKALQWYYEKQHGNKKKAHGSIGILPYIYQSAYNYYYTLFLAEQAAKNLTEEQIKGKTINVNIDKPREVNAAKRKSKLIDFEEDN